MIKLNENSKGYYVYRFLNKNYEVIYVGKSIHLIIRMNQHFSETSHLPNECYYEVNKVEYITLASEKEMDETEKYYISLWKPKYNIRDVNSKTTIDVSVHKW